MELKLRVISGRSRFNHRLEIVGVARVGENSPAPLKAWIQERAVSWRGHAWAPALTHPATALGAAQLIAVTAQWASEYGHTIKWLEPETVSEPF